MGNHDKPVPVAAESFDLVQQSVSDLQHTMSDQMRSLTERMDAQSTNQPTGRGMSTNNDVMAGLRVVHKTVTQIAESQARHWERVEPKDVVQMHRPFFHPLTGQPMRNATNINAFSRIEMGRNVFLPIASDSLIAGERFMQDIVDGLQNCLDLDHENNVSTLSSVNTSQLHAAVRGNATPPRLPDPTDMESPIGMFSPQRRLGSLQTRTVPSMGTLEEPMDQGMSAVVIKQEPSDSGPLAAATLSPLRIKLTKVNDSFGSPFRNTWRDSYAI